MVFDAFCGFGCFLVVLVVLAVAGEARWGTLYHHIVMVVGGFGGFLVVFWCFWPLLVRLTGAPSTIIL
jgi:hypothetical protein